MSNSAHAISHLRSTGNVDEAVSIALGRRSIIRESGGFAVQQTQTWFCPDQDALQQFILRLNDKLPEVTYSTSDTNNGSQGGYAVIVTGKYMDHDIAAMGPAKACTRIDSPPASL